MSSMSSLIRLALTAGLSLGLAATTASAGTFNFSYTTSKGGVLTGQVTGILQADLNTVIVSSLLSTEFNGVSGPALPFLTSVSGFFLSSGLSPALSLDGSVMDFCAATAPCSSVGFLFAPAGIAASVPIYNATTFYGNAFEQFAPARWSMTAARLSDVSSPAVPEPASLLLMGTAMAALATLAHRRR